MHKTVTEEKEVIELLKAGWTIDQPIMGNVMLIGMARLQESCGIVTDLFLRMRAEERIRLRRTTRAHPLFHGRVDIYGLVDRDD